MIALRILFWAVVICAAIFVLAVIGAAIYLSLVVIPVMRKVRLLQKYGYEYEREYYTKGDVSIPLSWIDNMSLVRLADYLARREEHDRTGV